MRGIRQCQWARADGQVELAGFKVGEVTGDLGRLGRPAPASPMQITDGYRLRAGRACRDRARLARGSAEPLRRDLQRHRPAAPEGATIPLARTDQPVEIDQFLSALDPSTRGELRSFSTTTVQRSKVAEADIEQALRHSAQAFDQTANLLADATPTAPR